MDPARWQQVKALVAEALDVVPAGREAFVASRCGTDSALRDEALSLLAASDDLEGFLETPAAARLGEAVMPEPKAPSWIGRRVGAYRIVAEIGAGGMGEVYRAVRADDQFQKQVAIKLIRRGHDTSYFVSRFKAERQILATLDHAGIARLLDGGVTEDGLPYFVMELVEGIPIDTYCAEHRLSVAARLELFRTVCAAVHFAHQRLVVHRDLKPGNILVTAQGEAKLLDFGIARIVDAAAPQDLPARTATEFRALTPEYASPEQIRNEPVTTASDVYSLGVMLFELLTGRSPYRSNSARPLEIAREICEQEPQRPSTVVGSEAPSGAAGLPVDLHRLRRQLRGDLDTIVLMALRKEPQRRYSSAEQLAEDLRRHLAGLPVIARTDTWTYRSGKFLRRHALGVAAVVAVVISLVAGIVLAQREARIANAERIRAERHFGEVRKLANAFLFEVHDAIQNLPGSTEARQMLVKNALQYLNALAEESGGDPSLQRELASAYEKVGDVQGGFRAGSLGDTAGALDSFGRALAIRQTLLAFRPEDVDLLRETARIHSKLGDVLVRIGKPAAAVEHSRTSLGLVERLAVLDPDGLKTRFMILSSEVDLGANLAEAGHWEEALVHSRRGVPLAETLARTHPEEPRGPRALALVYERVAWILTEGTGQYAEAVEFHDRSLAAIAPRLKAEPGNTDYRNITARALLGKGHALARQGRREEAATAFDRGLEHLEALAAADPKNAVFRFNAADGASGVGGQYARWGDARHALDHLQRAASHLRALPEGSRRDTRTRIAAALTSARMGEVHRQLSAVASANRSVRSLQQDLACAAYRDAWEVLGEPGMRSLLLPEDRALADAAATGAAQCATVR